MPNGDSPSISTEFIINLLSNSPKIIGKEEIGSSIAFIMEGTSFIGKRTLIVRANIDEMDYETASGLCIRVKEMDAFLKWCKENKNYDQGGYFVPPT